MLPLVDTEIVLAVDGSFGEPEIVIDHDDAGEWFMVRHEGEIVDLSLSDEGVTWKRTR